MRACVQRATRGAVRVDGETIGQIGRGLVVLLGVGPEDSSSDVETMADKLTLLRIFEDEDGKMNRSLIDVGGEMLIVSQFTLMGDCRKGRRPSFVAAAQPEYANELYEEFIAAVKGRGVQVATGKFRATMEVELVNDGPVTMLVDTKKVF